MFYSIQHELLLIYYYFTVAHAWNFFFVKKNDTYSLCWISNGTYRFIFYLIRWELLSFSNNGFVSNFAWNYKKEKKNLANIRYFSTTVSIFYIFRILLLLKTFILRINKIKWKNNQESCILLDSETINSLELAILRSFVENLLFRISWWF